jgi:competence protein ComEA
MDDTSAPWRALEDPAPALTAGGKASASGTPPTAMSGASSLFGRSPLTLVMFVAASVIAAIAVWLVVGSGHGAVVVDQAGSSVPIADRSARPIAVAPGAVLVVDVQGAVVRPGVTQLAAGSRVGDAIAAAGGYSPRVAADRIGATLNLAALVRDGDQIVVPSRDDPRGPPAGSPKPGGGTAAGPIDLNRATAEELDSLPGVGPATAAKIIAGREEQPFTSVDDLRTRKILGAATFEKVKDLVVVR